MNTINQHNTTYVLRLVLAILIVLNGAVLKLAYIHDDSFLQAMYITIPCSLFVIYNLKK